MGGDFLQYCDNDNNSIDKQKLKFLSVYTDKSYSGQFISDIQHDEINILGKASKKTSTLEDDLIKHTGDGDNKLLPLVEKFTEFQYNSKHEIDEKKKTELFVVDVFSGNYQIKGFNNFFDCTSNENPRNIKDKITRLYDKKFPTYVFSKKTNCDLLLNIYFKYIDTSSSQIPYDTVKIDNIKDDLTKDISATSYNILINNFWEKLIYLVELILDKDKTILNDDGFDIKEAINILKTFEFEFDDEGLKLKSYDHTNSAVWAPTQFSLAKKITDLYKIEFKNHVKESKKKSNNHLPNYSLKAVMPRKEPNQPINETINIISTYISGNNLKTKILVLSICKFLGDTSHILMTLILLRVKKYLMEKEITITSLDGKKILFETLKINLQLSERPMMIRSCLLDKYIIDSFNLNSNDLEDLIVFMKHVKVLKDNKDIDKQLLDFDEEEVEEVEQEETIPKFCYMYSIDPKYLVEKKKIQN